MNGFTHFVCACCFIFETIVDRVSVWIKKYDQQNVERPYQQTIQMTETISRSLLLI